MAVIQDPTSTYFERLLTGNVEQLLSGFAGAPAIDDPQSGSLRGLADFTRFVHARQEWLRERAARIEPVRTTQTAARTVVELLLRLQVSGRDTELPVGVVGERDGDLVRAIRVYHSFWPLEGRHRVRPPLLGIDHSARVADIVAGYQRALAAGDVEEIVATFEPDGYFREPAGGEHYYRGTAKLREFMGQILGTGGIGLEHCAVTDDGVACAIEFNAVTFGPQRLHPQAGLAVYERGRSGRLHAARIYDDVNVEALIRPAED